MKEFEFEDKKYELRSPNEKDVQLAQRHHNKVFAEGLKDPKTMTHDEMRSALKERGFFSDEKEAEFQRKQQELREKVEVLEAGGIELDEAEKIALEAKELREELLSDQLSLNAYFDKTVEKQAQNAREDFLLSRILYEKDAKSPYCKNLDDFYSKQDDPVVFQAYALFLNSDNYGETYAKLPEIDFLREYGYMDENFQLESEKVEEVKPKKKKPFLKNGKPVKKLEADEAKSKEAEPAEA